MIPRSVLEMWEEDILRLPVFCHMAIRRGMDNRLFVPMRRLISGCGYKQNRNKGKINDRIISVLRMFEQKDVILLADKKNLQIDSTVEIKLNAESFDIPKSFCIVLISEFNAIMHYKSNSELHNSKIMPEYLLYILSYIRINKSRRSDYQNNNPQSKPEIFFCQLNNMAKTLGISTKTLQRAIEILRMLNLIAVAPLPRYQDAKNNWHTDVTVFVDKYDGWERELQWGIDYLKSSKKQRPAQGTYT